MGTPKVWTRDALAQRLRDAAIVEQQLSLQYIYAALTLRWTPAEGIDPAATERARGAATSLMLLARQEMEHQGIVANLLAAIGEQPAFDVPRMPTDLPVGGRASLTGLDPGNPGGANATLIRMLGYERPDDLTDPALACAVPASLIEQLGEEAAPGSTILDLYEDVYEGLIAVAADDPPLISATSAGRQVTKDHEYGITVDEVTDLSTALTVVDQLTLEGEGASAASMWWRLGDERRAQAHGAGVPVDGPPAATTITPARSHFCRLVALWNDVQRAQLPTWPVVIDPSLDGRPGTIMINDPFGVAAVEAFNLVYTLVVDALALRYRAGAISDADETALDLTTFFRLMTMGIRPLGMIVVRAPAFAGQPDGFRAGPTFERVGTAEPSTDGLVDGLVKAGDAVAKLATMPGPYAEPELVQRLIEGLANDLRRMSYDLTSESSSRFGDPEGAVR